MAFELGASVKQLWKRAVFGTAIGNLDNHLRNHAFLMRGSAWEISPAYDMNPEPVDGAAISIKGVKGTKSVKGVKGARGVNDIKGTKSVKSAKGVKGGATDVYQLSLFGESELSLGAFFTSKALELFEVTKDEADEDLRKLNAVLKGVVSAARKAKLDAKSIEKIAPRFEL